MNEYPDRDRFDADYPPPRQTMYLPANDEGDDDQESPWHKLHSLLRGRYHWAILLMILGSLLGIVGYRSVTPLYRSNGHIGIQPYVDRILYKSEDSGVMPMFDAFVNSQMQYMQQQRVIERAMDTELWRTTGRGLSPEAQQSFRESLSVRRPPGNIIVVSFMDPDPDVARIAVEAVITAYNDLYVESDVQKEAQRLRLLTERRTSLNNQLRSIRDQISEIASEFGSDALDRIYDFRLGLVQNLEAELRKSQMELAALGGEVPVGDEPEEATPQLDVEGMTVQMLAMRDRTLNELLHNERALRTRLTTLGARFGEQHREYQSVLTTLETIEGQIVEQAAEVRRQLASRVAEGEVVVGTEDSKEMLIQRIQRLQTLHTESMSDTTRIGRRRLDIDRLRAEADTIQQWLEEVRVRIEQINVESAVSGRISIISLGDSPQLANQSKRKQMAVLGGGGGAMVGLGLVLLFGLLDRRIRSLDDTGETHHSMRMLGVLPALPKSLDDPWQIAMAANCVHHIRTMLQIRTRHSNYRSRTFAISGPVAGCGKTSLTLALGFSFADSGSKTLLIDADLLGGSLTKRLSAVVRRKLGELLLERDQLTSEELEAALEEAQLTGSRLGEILIRKGVIHDQQLADALSSQESGEVGLMEALDGRDPAKCIAPTTSDNLFVLPVGTAGMDDVSRISPIAVERLLQSLAAQFDVILIDNGPVPGSAESSVMAGVADEVVLVVSLGDQKTRLRHTIDYLRSLHVPIAGIVFNRADEAELSRSPFSTSVSRWSVRDGVATDTESVTRAARAVNAQYGPIASAVLSRGNGTRPLLPPGRK